jgi:soluble lytic murein transglycosylase-like protein
MRKRLHLALMASPVIATFLSLTPLPAQAAEDSSSSQVLTAVTDDSGRRVWVNESASMPKAASRPSESNSGRRLVYWSSTEHRYKPVPHAVMQAARSAAAEVNSMLENSSYLNVSRSSFTPEQVDAAIEQAAARHNLDPNLVRAVVKVESNFNPNAVSRKGAMGLMQLMPSTARQLKVTNPFDPEQNVDAGVRHLKALLQSYRGNVSLTLAAYNAGEGAVARSAGIPRIAETRDYVRRITALYNGGSTSDLHFARTRAAVRVQRDERGVLYISNTD